MTRILALDIGTKRTGVAFLDETLGIPLPLDTIEHASRTDLLERVASLISERRVDRLIIGLPLLPSGKEGAQAQHVRGIAETLEKSGIAVTLLDERYSSPRTKSADPDAAAALNLLQTITSSHLTSPPEKGERVG